MVLGKLATSVLVENGRLHNETADSVLRNAVTKRSRILPYDQWCLLTWDVVVPHFPCLHSIADSDVLGI